MNVIDALTAEHGVFRSQIGYIEQSVKHCDSVEKLMAQFDLLALALRRHAKLEDDLVFGPLRRKLNLQHALHDEHPLISDLVARVLEREEPDELSGLMMHFVRALRRHFSNEENALFPGAWRALTERELQTLGDQWAQRSGVKS